MSGHSAGASAQLVGTLGVLVEERVIGEPLGEEHVHRAEGERRVAAGPERQMDVGSLGRARADGIDAHDRGPPLARVEEELPEVQMGGHHVRAPRDDRPGVHRVLDVGRGPSAVGHAPSRRTCREADGAVDLRSAERVEEPHVHRRPALQHARGAHVAERQHAGGAAAVDCGEEPFPHEAECFVPGRLAERGAPLGPGAHQWREQPVGVVGALFVLLHLDAQVARGDRVIGVAVHSRDDAVVDRGDPRAVVGAVVRAGPTDLDETHCVPFPCVATTIGRRLRRPGRSTFSRVRRLGASAVTLNGIRLFAGTVDDPRARRASDVIQLVVSAFFLAILAVIAIPPTTIERALITFVASFPDFLDGLWQVLSDLFFVAAVFVLVASAVRRRWALVRDLVLAVVVAGATALVIGRLLEGEWLPAWKTLREVGPPPWVPALRIAVLGAVLLTARPHLSRPARRLSVWIVGLASISAVLLEATTPSGTLAAVLVAAIGAGVVHLIFGSCEGNPGLQEVAAALAQLGVDARSLGAADRQEAGLFLAKAEDTDGAPLIVKVYGRDAHDTQLLVTLWRIVWYRDPGSPIWLARRQQVANEGFVTLLAAQAGVHTQTVVTAGVTTRDDALLVLRPVGTLWTDIGDRERDEAIVDALWERDEPSARSGDHPRAARCRPRQRLGR